MINILVGPTFKLARNYLKIKIKKTKILVMRIFKKEKQMNKIVTKNK